MLLAGCQVLKYRPAIKQGRASHEYHCSPRPQPGIPHVSLLATYTRVTLGTLQTPDLKLYLSLLQNSVMSQQHSERTTCMPAAASLGTVPKSYRDRPHLVQRNYFWLLARHPPPPPPPPPSHPPPPPPKCFHLPENLTP